jgi:hypothetical protein
MGYSLSMYTAPAGEVTRLLGSIDQAAFDRILSSKANDLIGNDEFLKTWRTKRMKAKKLN